MNSKERSKLHKDLRKHWGSITEVANRTGLTINMVIKVLKSERNNDDVLQTATSVLLEREIKRLNQRQIIERNYKQALALAS